MTRSSKSGENPASRDAEARLTRREWVQRMLAGAGASLAAPVLGESAGPREQLVPLRSVAAAPADAASANWQPAFFDDHQNQTLIALAERIVPGSTRAQVNRFLDLALGADTRENQFRFVTSLNALEGEALRRFTKSFKDLAVSQQDEILAAASTAEPSRPMPLGEAETAPHTQGSAPNLRDYFEYLKAWISTSYYSSEVGMKDLGWDGENFYASLPGCAEGDNHP